MTDVICLSDDDDVPAVTTSVSAHAQVVNTQPLDLGSILGGSFSTIKRGGTDLSSIINGMVKSSSSSQSGGSSRPSKRFDQAANRLKSKTNVSVVHQVLPLSSGARPGTQNIVPLKTTLTPVRANASRSPMSDSSSLRIGNCRPFGGSEEKSGILSHRNSATITTTPLDNMSVRQGNGVARTAEGENGNGVLRELRERPAVVPSGSLVSENITNYHQVTPYRLANYTFDVTDGHSETSTEGSSIAAFQCSYRGCRRIVTGNTNFVNHLWAHVTTLKLSDRRTMPNHHCHASQNDSSDVAQLSMCPFCLARFQTPFHMQVHMTRAHSRHPNAQRSATCAICEKDAFQTGSGAKAALVAHLGLHDPNDAPYHCRRCRFRTNVRIHLIDHYMSSHNDTSLMCPFCLVTVQVPPYKKRRKVINPAEFVQHFISHEDGPQTRGKCRFCALVFVTSEALAEHQKEQHVHINPRWKYTARAVDMMNRKVSEVRLLDTDDKGEREREREKERLREQEKEARRRQRRLNNGPCPSCLAMNSTGDEPPAKKAKNVIKAILRKCPSCVDTEENEEKYGKEFICADDSRLRTTRRHTIFNCRNCFYKTTDSLAVQSHQCQASMGGQPDFVAEERWRVERLDESSGEGPLADDDWESAEAECFGDRYVPRSPTKHDYFLKDKYQAEMMHLLKPVVRLQKKVRKTISNTRRRERLNAFRIFVRARESRVASSSALWKEMNEKGWDSVVDPGIALKEETFEDENSDGFSSESDEE